MLREYLSEPRVGVTVPCAFPRKVPTRNLRFQALTARKSSPGARCSETPTRRQKGAKWDKLRIALQSTAFAEGPGEDVEIRSPTGCGARACSTTRRAIPGRELSFSCRLGRHLRLPWSTMRRATEFVAESVPISQRFNSFAGCRTCQGFTSWLIRRLIMSDLRRAILFPRRSFEIGSKRSLSSASGLFVLLH